MKLLISSISFRTFQSFGLEPMMGSSWCGMTIGTHHCSKGPASTLLPRSFVVAFLTSVSPLSPPWSIGSYWTDVYMVSYASFYYALLTCIVFLCRSRWRPKTHSSTYLVVRWLSRCRMRWCSSAWGLEAVRWLVVQSRRVGVDEWRSSWAHHHRHLMARRRGMDVFQACRYAGLGRGLLSAHRTLTRGQSHTTAECGSSTSLVLFFF
jgi:hypothetical protein